MEIFMSETKLAPNSKESEMMVLGCMLTSINALNIGADGLEDTDFYYSEHQIIFHVLKTASKTDKPADLHLVCEELKRQDKLKAVGGAAYLTTLAQYVGTSAYIEEYVNQVKDKSTLRSMINAAQVIEKKALSNPDNPDNLIEELQTEFKRIEQRHGKKIPIISPREHLEMQNKFLEKHRGKDVIGLRTSKIPEFNSHLLGLRELILLAAAPNVGKTALTIQLGSDVLENEETACLIYVSLEMSSLAIFNRMTLHYAGMDFKTFVLGDQKIRGTNGEVFFTEEELRKIKNAKEKLESFGDRLQIIDSEMCPFLDSRTILNHVEAIKSKTGCKRAIVIIDYLQVWPTPQNMGENEAEKWRIGEMKKIRDGIQNDPVIVISESRKPSDKNEQWGGELADVMGSARVTYTPDAVLFLNPIQSKQLTKLWEDKKMPNISYKEDDKDITDKDDPNNIKGFLASHGIAICNLKMPKGRDGMKKFSTLLAFHFNRNKFEKVDWQYILGLVMKVKSR